MSNFGGLPYVVCFVGLLTGNIFCTSYTVSCFFRISRLLGYIFFRRTGVGDSMSVLDKLFNVCRLSTMEYCMHKNKRNVSIL